MPDEYGLLGLGLRADRRTFLKYLGVNTGMLGVGASGGFGTSQAFFQPSVESLLGEVDVDPYWRTGIWQNATDSLRRPGERPATPSRGAASSLPVVYADAPTQGVELYYFDEAQKAFRLPYNLPVEPGGTLRLTASLYYFNPSTAQFGEKSKQATLRLDLADKKADPPPAFFLSLSGMNVYHHAQQNDIPSIGPQFFTPVEPGKEMVVESGVVQLKFNLWRHKPESFWSKAFGFLRNQALPVLKPYLPLPNLVTAGVDFLNDVIGVSKSASHDEPVWESQGLDLVVTEEARQRLGFPFGFRSGYWVVTDKNAPILTEPTVDAVLDPATGLLVSRQNRSQRVLLDHNYLVWHCHLARA